jgi:hypothetical protein
LGSNDIVSIAGYIEAKKMNMELEGRCRDLFKDNNPVFTGTG